MSRRKQSLRKPRILRDYPKKAELKIVIQRVFFKVAKYGSVGNRINMRRILNECPEIVKEIRAENPKIVALAIKNYKEYQDSIKGKRK